MKILKFEIYISTHPRNFIFLYLQLDHFEMIKSMKSNFLREFKDRNMQI